MMKLAKTKRKHCNSLKLSFFVHKLTLKFHAKKWRFGILVATFLADIYESSSVCTPGKNPHCIYYEIAVRVVLTFDKLRHDVWYVPSL